MSTRPIIQVEGVSKRYMIGHQARHDTLVDTLRHGIAGMWAAWRQRRAETQEEFWALRDVSFNVQAGEVVGIIGRNGAGKSTLLKILSRITEPTTGSISLRGRVASLLEVGTGFHPELTGRDNIFLNGAILGMSRAEIRRKFDEIVAFAEIEKFIDTPVKRYSSGMYVRLAFAVAAHLEPEILIVDEVLAVGDAQFQKKCMGKMKDVSTQGGRTVIFVSHHIAAVRQLCTLGLFLKSGRNLSFAPTATALAAYLNDSQGISSDQKGRERMKSEVFSSLSVAMLDQNGSPIAQVLSGDPVTFRINYRQKGLAAHEPNLGISLQVIHEGHKLTNFWNHAFAQHDVRVSPEGYWDCHVPRWPFRTGTFHLTLFIHRGDKTLAWIDECLEVQSLDGYFHGGARNPYLDEGMIFVDHAWKT